MDIIQLKLEDLVFKTDWDDERIYLNASYQGSRKASLSLRRPIDEDIYEFIASEEFQYIKTKLLKVIQKQFN